VTRDVPCHCWLDDGDGAVPSPCVFDDPQEIPENCCHAMILQAERRPKQACVHYRSGGEVTVPVPVVFNREDWAEHFGIEPGEVEAHARHHLSSMLVDYIESLDIRGIAP